MLSKGNMSEPTATTEANTLEVAELEIQRLPLSEVSPHPDNPRLHSPEQIKALQESIRLDGYIAGSMAIQRSTRTLYKGHGVYEALIGLGCIEADFVVKDLTDAETLALLARDNALSDMSINDGVKLKVISVKLEQMNVPIKRMGYNLEAIENIRDETLYRESNARYITMDDGEEQTAEELWEGMPEFEQEDVAHQSIQFHFATQADVDALAQLIGQKITDKTRYVWLPELKRLNLQEFGCSDDES